MLFEQIEEKLVGYRLNSIGYTLKSADLVQWCAPTPTAHGSLTIRLGFHFGLYQDAVQRELNEFATQHCPNITLKHTSFVGRHAVQPGVSGKLQVRNIVAVASGKGGVGKSTASVMLALGLQRAGAKVGLVDADIYGPSIPHMLGCQDASPRTEDNKLYPVDCHGLATLSMGHLVSEDSAMIWRGPMATQALTQLVSDTVWPELDYLIVDMPPGTGDIPLSLAQKIPVSGTLLVTTPQPVSLLDVRRALKMFLKLNIPILGIVENMSYAECSNCHHLQQLFSGNAGECLASESGMALLSKLPLSYELQEACNAGQLQSLLSQGSGLCDVIDKLALEVAKALSARALSSHQVKLDSVVVAS